jgi:hypothetical protein
VFGILAQQFLTSELDDKQQLADDSLQRCFQAIEKISIAMPDAVADIVLNDPDLIPVRKTTAFAAFWKRLTQQNDPT